MECSPNALHRLEYFRSDGFRALGWVVCCIVTFPLFICLTIAHCRSHSYSTYMYEVLWNVPMACSPARWWVPTPRTHISIESVRICNYFAPAYLQTPLYLLVMCSNMIYLIWLCIVCVFTQQLDGVQPHLLEPSRIFSERWIQDFTVSVVLYRYYF